MTKRKQKNNDVNFEHVAEISRWRPFLLAKDSEGKLLVFVNNTNFSLSLFLSLNRTIPDGDKLN